LRGDQRTAEAQLGGGFMQDSSNHVGYD
jgi:hypothetical protein